jgi:hypothetical protein
MRELNLQLGREEQAKALRRVRKDYEQHSNIRNLIAHATLAGTLSDGRLVFLSYQSMGRGDQLPAALVPEAEIERALKWGEAINREIDAMLDALPEWKLGQKPG